MFGWIRTFVTRVFASSAGSPASWFVDWIRGEHESDSGVSLDGKTCLRYAPVWYAVRRISGHVAQLPLVLYRRTGERSKERAKEHPAFQLVKRKPNGLMTASVFRELLQYHALLWGNGRAAIVRNNRGDAMELIPLLPDRTKTVLVNGEKWHVTHIHHQGGEIEERKVKDADCLHIQGLGYDGIQGYALWEIAKNSWGLGIGSEKQTARFYKNNAVPGLILEAPPGVFQDDEEAKNFLHAFRDMHEGLDNASKTALLREGIKASKLSNTAQEAQQIETRQFQRQEVALWFLLEAITGDDASVSYSSLEQKHIAYLVNCLNGWLVKWQEQCEEKLLREREKVADTHFFRFSTGALLRSDMKTTVETLGLAVRAKLMTPNEARDLLDMDEMEGGDELSNPAITPGFGPAKPPAPPEPKPDPATGDPIPDPAAEKLQQRLREIIRGRLQDLLDVERKRVADLAGKPKQLGEWYERWQKTLATALACLGSADAQGEAEAWVKQSQAELAAGSLVDVLGTWGGRVESLADALVQREPLSKAA